MHLFFDRIVILYRKQQKKYYQVTMYFTAMNKIILS